MVRSFTAFFICSRSTLFHSPLMYVPDFPAPA
jgi:hypothetical protein